MSSGQRFNMQGQQTIYPIYHNSGWSVVPVVSYLEVRGRDGRLIQRLKSSEVEEAIQTVDDLARVSGDYRTVS